ncbi:hypothetical protein GP486_006306 [Trichoglossum hirsutum]|uniref:Ubiquitin-like domain-containing protein n=1 Tax=Trichoglossum hirsutum TaxID=265104 RepID=A0A9P8IH38_9PEZI|nr:hypothetical protein GP486_006306 [Trichoglossum hirsutum]
MDNMDMEYSYDNPFPGVAGADVKGKQKATDQDGSVDHQNSFYFGRGDNAAFSNINSYPLSPPESEPDFPISPSIQPLNLRHGAFPPRSAPLANNGFTNWASSPSPFALAAPTTNITYPLSPPASDYGTPAPAREPATPQTVTDTAFQILVRDLNGRTITIDEVKSTTSVREIKEKYSEKGDVPVCEIRLIFSGKEMSDGE